MKLDLRLFSLSIIFWLFKLEIPPIAKKCFLLSFVEFLNSINLTEDGDYYIKVRDSYMTPETQLVNVDSERTVYLKDIDNALK